MILQQSDDNEKWFYNRVMIMKMILQQSDDNENDFTSEY